MSVRPPRALQKQMPQDPLTASLQQEILAEKAATHARLVRRLEAALAALTQAEQEAGSAERATGTKQEAARAEREDCLDAAGAALWELVVHRELCGLHHTERFLRDLNVPRAVWLRMGLGRRRR